MKKCSKCGVLKPLDMFNKRSASKDGHQPTCRSCTKVYDKDYRDTHPNHKKAWYDAHPNYNKAWYDSHKEEILANCKAYHDSHKEEKKAYNKAYYANKCIW